MRGWFAGKFRAALIVVLLSPAWSGSGRADPLCPAGDDRYAAMFTDRGMFERAIDSALADDPSNEKLGGITVPHHLAAPHLIALGVHAASGFSYKRIVILTPDHFFRAGKRVATTARGFATIFGDMDADRDAVSELTKTGLVEDSCLFAKEHGVQALLPFLHQAFPDARIVPVAISIKSGRADWDQLADALEPLVDDETLIVQSTDFSHYLPQPLAKSFDQQTLNVIASGSLDAIAALTQPDHADSVGALYVQTTLQQRRGMAPLVIANENLQQYSKALITETTSYLVILHGRFGPDFANAATGREHFLYLAGDMMVGRAMTRLLLDERAAARIETEILKRTKGRPLVVNLEGVLLPEVPDALPHMALGMPADLAIDWLKRLNAAGVSLANNHALDLGEIGYAETRAALSKAGIPAFGQGESIDLTSLRLTGLTDLGTNGSGALDLITPALIDRLTHGEARPGVAFVHWGSEYAMAPGPRENALIEAMRLAAVQLVVGAHPHVADGKLRALAGGDTLLAYSLGNFLFDQPAERASGSILEIRSFAQGTFFARLIALPNLYDLGRKAVQQP